MLFATAVSDLSIADALAEPSYRGVFVQLAQEVLAAAPVPVEPFDGFDADDLDGSIDRLVEFNRRSAKTHSGIYRDLMVRKRRTEKSMLTAIDGPLLLTDARADHGDRGRPPNLRSGEPRPARRLSATPGARAGAQRGDHRARTRRARCHRPVARRRGGGQGQHRRRRRRDDERVDRRRATGGRARRDRRQPPPRRRRRPALQDEPARVRGRQRQPRLRDDVQPARPKPHVRRLELRLRGAGRRRRRRLRARHRHRRLDPDPRRLLRHRRAEADLRARAGRRACFRSRRASTTSGRSRRPSPRRAACSRCWPASRSTRLRRRGSECCAASSRIRT